MLLTKQREAEAMAIVVEVERRRGFVRHTNKAPALEASGWRNWLLTLFPFWFAEEFSAEHEQYWELHWDALMRIRAGHEEVPNKELVKLLLLGRGLGKSSLIEAARIMRGSLLNGGYSLIISETDDQAQEHLGNCRILIEHPDSRLLEYYPGMSITDNADALKGMPSADRKEMFICKNGYILRGKGLSAKMRGLRVGIHRPDDLALDDIDDVNDSLALSSSKLRLITASILPVQARENVTIDVGQNLISEHSVVNQILKGKTDALAERTVIGVANAFTTLDIDSAIDDTGKMRHVIRDTSIPSWKGFSVIRAQKFLDNSGLQTFLAEYQNQFDQFKSGKVISNYDENAQVITWSQFQAVFGERRIPSHWSALAGLDVGYSDGQYPHYSAWDFIATAAMNSPLPGALFLYRSKSFVGTSIDDQAIAIKADLYRDEMQMIRSWQMSHERTGEMMTLQQKYQLPFRKFQFYKAEDGVAQWKHLSMPDRTRPHPFKDDEILADGTYRIGRPTFYYIVDDTQLVFATDDKGAKLLRDQVATWEYVPVKLTEQGISTQKPSKVNDDHCFVAGTQIKTLYGDRNIEDVRAGDYVLTRHGYQRCESAEMTSSCAETMEIVLSNGSRLQGTPNHPIWLNDRDFIALQKVRISDTVKGWQQENVLTLMAWRFTGILKQSSEHIASIIKPIKHGVRRGFQACTSRFGKASTERCRRVSRFITRMKTLSITTFPTWNAFLPANTAGSTNLPYRTTLNVLGLSGYETLAIKPPLGIKAMKGEHGIEKRLVRVDLDKGMQQLKIAPSADNHFRASTRDLDSVPQGAIGYSKRHRSLQRGSMSLSARCAATLRGVCGQRKKCAIKVVTVNSYIDAPVYNLTVAKYPEYYANGILVHNCDVLKALLAYFGAAATALTPAERREAALPANLQQDAKMNQPTDAIERINLQRAIEFQKIDKVENQQRAKMNKYRPTVPSIGGIRKR